MNLLFDHKTGLYHRDGDLRIIHELPSYRLMDPQPTDVILDIGGFVGSVARWMRASGARVISYEPHPESFALLQMNAPHLSDNNYAALVPDNFEGDTCSLYVNRGKDNSAHSILSRRGRGEIRVPAVKFSEVVENYQPNKVKMDCEGGEYVLLANPLASCVRLIAMEFHLTRGEWHARGQDIRDSLLGQGFREVVAPKFFTKNWNTFGVFTR